MAALAALTKKVWSARRLLVLLLAPLALLPVVFALPPKEGRCLFIILLMAVYWCTEALPLSVTALLPIVFFPFMGILPSHKVCPQYFLDTNFLFLSGLIMACAIEEWNLHRRIALKVLMLVGVQPARLILGMMVTTSFMSMWLSNTASTAMMLPIASAILKSLFGQKEARKDLSRDREDNRGAVRGNGLHTVPAETQFLASTHPEGRSHSEEVEAPLDLLADSKKEEEYHRNIWKGFLISIPYSASIGGTATLTGTAPNLILLGQLKSFFPQCDVVNFGSWFIFAFPLMLLFLLVGWLWISFLYGGLSFRGWRKKKSEIRSDAEDKALVVIREEFQNLGPISFAERAVFILFCTFAILLFSRDPKFIPGWASLFKPGFVSDAVTGMTIVTILFFFPSQRPSLKWWLDFKAPNVETKPLLTWQKAQESVPWNIILLLGGGFAMAKGCEESGLSVWIGGQLHPLENVPPVLAVLLITIVIAFFTEFASNTATIIIFLPVLAELAIRLRVHPLYLMIPGTVGCSYAFMLPVSTPPNSIAFASGDLLVKDMVRTGLLMNVMGVLLLSVAMNTWAQSIFQLATFPDWASPHWANVHAANVTAPPPTLPNNTLHSL